MTPALVFSEGPLSGRRVEVDAELVVGREDAGLTIEDEEISRRHAVIRPGDGNGGRTPAAGPPDACCIAAPAAPRPGWAGSRGGARYVPFNSVNTTLFVPLACASIAVDDCSMMLLRVKSTISSAMSASRITDSEFINSL